MIIKNDDYKYVAKVYVDDIEGWQDCKIIHMYRDRAVVITRTGTQLNRILKNTEDAKEDRCIYWRRGR